jgi:hypothetical protein
MKRKRRVFYWVEPSREYRLKYGFPFYHKRKWYHGSNELLRPCSSSADCTTYKKAEKCAQKLGEVIGIENVVISKFFYKNGNRYCKDYKYR